MELQNLLQAILLISVLAFCFASSLFLNQMKPKRTKKETSHHM